MPSARIAVPTLARFPLRRRRLLSAFVFALATILTTSDVHAQQLSLQWIDTSNGVAGFSILRKIGTIGTYGVIALQPPGLTSYVDVNVAYGATYCYRVQAVTANVVSEYSNEACGTPGATPAPTGFTVQVVENGTGVGSVVSQPPGINCGAGGSCSATFPSGTVVTLQAIPGRRSTFSGWSGDGCSGSGQCTLTGNQPMVVTAIFSALSLRPTGPKG